MIEKQREYLKRQLDCLSVERINTETKMNYKLKLADMKRKFFFMTLIAIVLMYTGYNFYSVSARNHVAVSNLRLANVEALANNGETADGRKLYELHYGSGYGTQCKASSVTGNPCAVERSCS